LYSWKSKTFGVTNESIAYDLALFEIIFMFTRVEELGIYALRKFKYNLERIFYD